MLETWSANERMRNVPAIDWMARKLDGDIRRRIEHLYLPYSDLPASDARHPALESEFRALCRNLERVCEVSRRSRGALHPPTELSGRLRWLVGQAVANLNAVDTTTFGRRYPFHTFERSNAEPLWAAILSVIDRVKRLHEAVREFEPEIDEKILEDLVNLTEPMRREPIA